MHRRSISFFGEMFKTHIAHHKRYYAGKSFAYPPGVIEEVDDLPLSLGWDMLAGLIVIGPLVVLSWQFVVSFLVVLLVHNLVWNAIHFEMHRPEHTWFANFVLYKYLARYHWLHHKYQKYNYNIVLPMWDFILRTHIRATPKDVQELTKLGYV